jgi:putative FmdB family regulatory protein
MPIYVYACPECELEIEEMRPMAQADAPMWCPACGAECGRGITNFAAVAGRARGESQAVATPTGQSIHRAGCACCYPIRH